MVYESGPPFRGDSELIWSEVLPVAPETVAKARNGLELAKAGSLQRDARPDVLEDLRLLTSELVTNSVRHGGLEGGDTIELRVSTSAKSFRVEVLDRGRGFRPEPPAPSSLRVSGWGLYLIDRVSDRWGVETNDMTCVWFEIDRRY
jgi:anti-sigma regulatory factor (Ser/Thr protein kinase)